MNCKQIERFVKKVHPTPVEISYFNDESDGANLGWAESWIPKISLNTLYVNNKRYQENEGTTLKAAIFHELGHIHYKHERSPSCYEQSIPRQELTAQLFAIRKSHELKMFRIHRMAIYWLWTWGISESKFYKEAYDLSIKDEECIEYYKKYGHKIP